MKLRFLLYAIACAISLCSTTAAWADYSNLNPATFTNLTTAGEAEKYGINYPEQPAMAGGAITPTSHHRFGQQTGIGSSTFQTEANTSEAQSKVQYTPTGNAPGPVAVPGLSTPNLGLFRSPAQSMFTTPVLEPSVTSMPSLGSMMSPGLSPANEIASPSEILNGESPAFGHKKPRGALFDLHLENPFQGL